ncbi:MAG: TlpA disulfide reductase family protein [Pseudomonadota bacterium]
MKNGFFSLLVATSFLVASNLNAGELNQVAPDFVLKSNNGQNIRLSDLRGEVVLLNFWATWCGPCRQEMPLLDDLHSRYKDMGFKVIGVNVENTPSKADAMLAKNPVSFPILYDTQSVVSKLYNVDAMPTTVVVDRDGNMRHLHRGFKPGYEDAYAAQVKQLFREQYAVSE